MISFPETLTSATLFVTDFGDSGLLLVVAALVTLHALARGRRATAGRMLLAVLAAGMGMLLMKLIFIGCSAAMGQEALRSPSGHAALSAAVYGTLAGLASRHLSTPWRVLVWAAALALIGSIAASRVVLGFHTISEVLLGVVWGIASAWLAWRVTRAPQGHRTPVHAAPLVASLVFALVMLHGVRLPSEPLVQFLSYRLALHTPCDVQQAQRLGEGGA